MSSKLGALKESPKPELPCLPRLAIGALAVIAALALLLGGVLA